MYYITWTDKQHNLHTITNLPLERAIMYVRRYRKRGIQIVITKQESQYYA